MELGENRSGHRPELGKIFSYKFNVVKADGKWKISYLQGFDYKESIK